MLVYPYPTTPLWAKLDPYPASWPPSWQEKSLPPSWYLVACPCVFVVHIQYLLFMWGLMRTTYSKMILVHTSHIRQRTEWIFCSTKYDSLATAPHATAYQSWFIRIVLHVSQHSSKKVIMNSCFSRPGGSSHHWFHVRSHIISKIFFEKPNWAFFRDPTTGFGSWLEVLFES